MVFIDLEYDIFTLPVYDFKTSSQKAASRGRYNAVFPRIKSR